MPPVSDDMEGKPATDVSGEKDRLSRFSDANRSAPAAHDVPDASASEHEIVGPAAQPEDPVAVTEAHEGGGAGIAGVATGGGDGTGGISAPERRPKNLVAREMWLATFITVCVFLAELGLEKTALGEWAAFHAIHALVKVLPDSEGQLPVVVVDTSTIPGGYTTDDPTDRAQLWKVLEALNKVHPKAVGIDLDFSGNVGGWLNRADAKNAAKMTDPEFFENCLSVKDSMPIYLGVFRDRERASKYWLGLPQYKELAANLASPHTTRYEVLPRVQRQLVGANSAEPLPGLAYALALRWADGKLPGPPSNLEQFIQPVDEDSDGQLVNYSQIDKLNSERFTSHEPTTLVDMWEKLQGRIVILGSISKSSPHFSSDYFYEPGRDDEKSRIPGPYYHASAVYTLLEAPLYEFNPRTRGSLDIALSLIFLGSIWVKARYAASRTPSHERRAVAIEFAALIIAITALSGIAIFCVRMWQVVWLDVFLVAVGLAIHFGAAPFVKGTFPRWFEGKS